MKRYMLPSQSLSQETATSRNNAYSKVPRTHGRSHVPGPAARVSLLVSITMSNSVRRTAGNAQADSARGETPTIDIFERRFKRLSLNRKVAPRRTADPLRVSPFARRPARVARFLGESFRDVKQKRNLFQRMGDLRNCSAKISAENHWENRALSQLKQS